MTATTQYGKTFAVAAGLGLLVMSIRGPYEILVVAPTRDRAKRLRDYFARNVVRSQVLQDRLESAQGGGPERIVKEASRRRLTFAGDVTLHTLTAGGALMGHGGDLVVLDEAGELDYGQYAQARRMIGGSRRGRLIEVGNPWSRTTPFHDSWVSDRYHQIRIDWQQAVEEGRIDRAFVDEQRERLSPIEFTVLYESRFPETAEDALYRWAWIQDALDRDWSLEGHEDVQEAYGLDVAEAGVDHSVLVRWLHLDDRWHLTDVWTWDRRDTMATVAQAESHLPDDATIAVDAVGVGKGVADRLQEDGYRVHQFKASQSPRDPDRYKNRKAEQAWRLRDALEHGRVRLVRHRELLRDLERARYEVRNGKLYVHAEGDKSPDWWDAACIGLAARRSGAVWSAGTKPRPSTGTPFSAGGGR